MIRKALPLLLAALLIHLALVLPNAPARLPWTMAGPPVELPLVLALLCITGARARFIVVPLLSILVILKIADLAMMGVLGRAFDPLADLPLIDAAMRLISGSLGVLAAVGVAVSAIVLAAIIVAGLWWATGRWAGVRWSAAQKFALFGVATAILLLGYPYAKASVYALSRIETARQTHAELRLLRVAADKDPFLSQNGLLSAIDRDVLVIFVESYGRGSFETPFYAERHLATLRQAEGRLAGAGLKMRSGFLRSPTQGGQSWLAHATFANGLWIKDQASYGTLLRSGRQGLFHYARRAGFSTLAVMPAITRAWPESASMGFDRVLAADDLGYRGKPFDWVTMPDQFTLAAIDRLVLGGKDRPRKFVQVALISSHAPWVPVPWMLSWDGLGDGTEFDAMTHASETPEVVWRDPVKVRESYRDALDYALQAVFGYVELHAADAPLIFVLGDHQTAQGIAPDGGRDVPLHVIGPQALVARTAAWGLQPGLVPPMADPIPMDRMRDLILGSFSDP
ncbi:sulfatase-like hydrolase/transferase [Paracoccus aestuariivivens]|uniref:Sulfatase n=1 Tax=Paracoccus aestuariivivens TaxID=1820333 RepID=A0A6L6JA14_9RHOB|nr:sulfatase-like hydrolase/transferase [Paracoccus aestuariivivens]MTH76841.1 sulfatase [Paracoccus aestuariivivens]